MTGQPKSVGDGDVLHAKYLDYCSAQLADLLLYLSPDEIFQIVEKASGSESEDSAPRSYSEIVEVATRWLAERIALPPFEIWARDYAANPERYDDWLMGLWDSDTRVRLDG